MSNSRLLAPRAWLHLLIIRPLLNVVFGVNVIGREHLNGLERYILIANHNSHLDVFLLFHALPARDISRTHPVAAVDYFSRPALLRRAVELGLDPIWVDRDHKKRDPLKEMQERLEQGHNIILFPEGTRGEPGRIARFRTGVGRLVQRLPGVPVVPVFLSGPERSFPKDSPVPMPLWNHVVVGPPRVLSGDAADITATLETTIRELAGSDSARRHKRRARSAPPATIAVLGIDGSGKSSVSRRLAESMSGHRRVCRVSDRIELYEGGRPAPMQPLLAEKLRERLGSFAKSARSLKLYKVPKLAELLLRDHLLGEVRRWYSPEVLVLDGSPLLNLTAWSILYKGEQPLLVYARAMAILTGRDRSVSSRDPIFREFPELLALKRLKLTQLRLPDAAILLDLDAALSCERIHGRGERVQAHETEERLARLRRGYLTVCDAARAEFGVRVSVVDASHAPERVTGEALAFAEKVCKGGPLHA